MKANIRQFSERFRENNYHHLSWEFNAEVQPQLREKHFFPVANGLALKNVKKFTCKDKLYSSLTKVQIIDEEY